MTARIRELAFEGAPTQQIRKASIAQGMTTLYEDGIRKVLGGVTTLEEVFRVAKKNEKPVRDELCRAATLVALPFGGPATRMDKQILM